MKSNAAKVVADSLLRIHYKEVKLGKFTFKIYQPTIKEMYLIFGENTASINDNMKRFELISQMPEHLNNCVRALSLAVSIKKPDMFRILAYKYILNNATMEQIVNAFIVLSSVINGKELFDNVKQDKVHSKNGQTQTVGANSIFGALGLLMDSLHLSYKEAFETIPYPCLLMMNSDKLRVLGPDEEVMVEVTGKELARMRKEAKHG